MKTVALIIRPVGNKYQALLPGNILVKEFRNKWDALKFSITEDEKVKILESLQKDLKVAKVLGENVDTIAVKAAPLRSLQEPEGFATREDNQIQHIMANKAKRKHKDGTPD